MFHFMRYLNSPSHRDKEASTEIPCSFQGLQRGQNRVCEFCFVLFFSRYKASVVPSSRDLCITNNVNIVSTLLTCRLEVEFYCVF